MSGDPFFPVGTPSCVRQLAVGDGHLLHVEEYGPPDGLPVVFLHDGPGIGCLPEHHRLFDPQRFRAILIDQRGSGYSLPTGLQDANTTPDLVADLEYVREALGIPAWIVFGNGWGSLLGLAYAQLFPEFTVGVVLCGVFLGSGDEIDGRIRAWIATLSSSTVDDVDFRDLFRSTVTRDILDHLGDHLFDPDQARAERAAQAWFVQPATGTALTELLPPPAHLGDARLQLHYLSRRCFIADGSLLAGMGHIRHLPGVIVQGLDDPIYPPRAAENLHRAWPEATWMPLHGAGHDLRSPPIARVAIKALDWVAECVLTE